MCSLRMRSTCRRFCTRWSFPSRAPLTWRAVRAQQTRPRGSGANRRSLSHPRCPGGPVDRGSPVCSAMTSRPQARMRTFRPARSIHFDEILSSFPVSSNRPGGRGWDWMAAVAIEIGRCRAPPVIGARRQAFLLPALESRRPRLPGITRRYGSSVSKRMSGCTRSRFVMRQAAFQDSEFVHARIYEKRSEVERPYSAGCNSACQGKGSSGGGGNRQRLKSKRAAGYNPGFLGLLEVNRMRFVIRSPICRRRCGSFGRARKRSASFRPWARCTPGT